MAAIDDKQPGQADRRADPFLVYDQDGAGQRLFPLHPGLRRVTIGRGPSNDITLSWDSQVARVHAELERLAGHWTLVDDGLSSVGTHVNGERIRGRHRLRDGDVVELGSTSVTFHLPKPKRSRAKRSATPAAPKLTPTQRRVLEALCRPYKESEFATPASSQQIAEELFLSSDAVNAHLRALCSALGLDGAPTRQRRTQLAMHAMQLGIVR